MAIHVQDEKTDWLVREFARRRGVGITAAIKAAVEESMDRDRHGAKENAEMLLQRIQPILDQIQARRTQVQKSEKAFMDEMWGEGS